MKTIYRGHEINVKREKCLGGWDMLFYSIFRLSDGYEVDSGFENSFEKVNDKIGQMKKTVDDEIEHPENYEDEDA